ncbi:bile acid:sodium symporter family protein [uncultured Sphaerochaeta sp.]|uniref:bile acid:sodium symporter family protein n=1 Tax=uncultured Sphaerochaeta sp. TaxID=886478 RepID=UPI002A0A7469|nr:bile acid:sodium symporter family protein [uncultured Sphaerochaeta sp.]
MFHFQNTETKLRQFNHSLEHLMPVLTPFGVILGLILGTLVSWMNPSVTYLFAFLTFCGALGINTTDFFKVLRHPKPIIFFLIGANIIMPFLAWALASLVFHSNIAMITGYILLLSIPTAVSGYIWSSIYEGNGALSLTFILISTALAPIFTPFTVKLLAQTSIAIDTTGMMLSLFKMVVIPSILGIVINNLTKGQVNEHITPSLRPFSKLALFLVIIINTSQVSKDLLANASWSYLPVALVCATIASLSFPIAYVLGRIAKLSREDNISLTFAISLRNISAALILAINYFPPETALPVIFGIVLQQTICAIMGHFLFGKNQPAS